jgi:hypothetical protein
VAVTPGIDFGTNCEGYIRLSYAHSLDNIKKGMDRLDKFLKRIQGKIRLNKKLDKMFLRRFINNG